MSAAASKGEKEKLNGPDAAGSGGGATYVGVAQPSGPSVTKADGSKMEVSRTLESSPSGDLSPYAQKIISESFVWLASLIVWGSGCDFATKYNRGTPVDGTCNGICVWQIICGLMSWLFMTFILVMNFMCETGRASRYGWFSHKFEMQLLFVPCLIWIPGVAAISARDSPAVGSAVFFSWMCFAGSFYAATKAYRSFREEDEPDPIPKAYLENPYIYG
ncbi:hypothetical protein FVE85_1467 [Porphyridium purpureum]|uniref:MARVEL domain-containing protein n=1 Tax=Porphyridium purpureum TaxID=35688 RepID=A0A5J4YWS3_PORPP|nr:hypothetical protein FVE85_1467 [Porphyridium purpureum]|eukprot:POR7609..scf209_3